MVIGQSGQPGQPVLFPVRMAPIIVTEVAPTHNLSLEEIIVLI